jgi:hypothetical protein
LDLIEVQHIGIRREEKEHSHQAKIVSYGKKIECYGKKEHCYGKKIVCVHDRDFGIRITKNIPHSQFYTPHPTCLEEIQKQN